MTLLCLTFKDKQDENYNVFSSLEDIKLMVCHQYLFRDYVDSCLYHVEIFLMSGFAFRDRTNPPSDSAHF